MTGHLEYDPDTLLKEYLRDVKKGLGPEVPENYFAENDSSKPVISKWRSTAHLFYSNWQKNTIPFFLIDGSLFLSYFEKDKTFISENIENSEILQNKNWTFYRGIAPSKGFMISPQSIPENITGYIIDGDKLYDVRYWQTDMDYSTDYINFTYKDGDLYVSGTIPVVKYLLALNPETKKILVGLCPKEEAVCDMWLNFLINSSRDKFNNL